MLKSPYPEVSFEHSIFKKMRFQLKLVPQQANSIIPANYQYPLSAAIYRIISRADEVYSEFLHNKGYRLPSGKSFKLFSFSDLKTPFRIKGDRIWIIGANASLTLSFHIEEAATNFIKGLFLNQQLEIADKLSGARFLVNEVQLLPDSLESVREDEPEVLLQPISPLVTGRKNENGSYTYLGPEDPEFTNCLAFSWIEKYRAVNPDVNTDSLRKRISLQVMAPVTQSKSRLITIKAFTPQQTKIRGFTHFRMKVRAPKDLLELALNGGLGLYCSQGMGCMEMKGFNDSKPIEQ